MAFKRVKIKNINEVVFAAYIVKIGKGNLLIKI